MALVSLLFLMFCSTFNVLELSKQFCWIFQFHDYAITKTRVVHTNARPYIVCYIYLNRQSKYRFFFPKWQLVNHKTLIEFFSWLNWMDSSETKVLLVFFPHSRKCCKWISWKCTATNDGRTFIKKYWLNRANTIQTWCSVETPEMKFPKNQFRVSTIFYGLQCPEFCSENTIFHHSSRYFIGFAFKTNLIVQI